MIQRLNRMSSKIASLFLLVFNMIRQNTEYKFKLTNQYKTIHQKLACYILEINKKNDSSMVISETALCLQDILGCRLSGFAVEKNRKELKFFGPDFHPDGAGEKSNMDDMILHELKNENYHSKLYLHPPEKHINVLSYHDEVINFIMQACTETLLRLDEIKELTSAASTDPLTRCYNRREFENQLKRNIALAIRHKSDLSLFMFDLDHFKKINDTHGHPGGDKVLKEVAALVRENIRTGDILARYGGEEFITVLPETDKTKAIELADRLRRKISQMSIRHQGEVIKVTASFGVSALNHHADMTRIIQDADTMLYKAKLNGRNTVMPGLFKIISNSTESEIKIQQTI